jgi:micrococcal nuclease
MRTAVFCVFASLASAHAAIMSIVVSAARAEPCGLVPEVSRVVARVEPAGTLVLDDGSEVVLVGALLPVSLNTQTDGDTPWPPAESSRKSLEALVGGKAVDLAFAGRRLDRYGRQLAHVFVGQGVSQVWVQRELIETGVARAYGLPDNQTCIDELLVHEQNARMAHRGHWGTGIFADRSADHPRELTSFRDSFQTVEGRVDRLDRIRGHRLLQLGPDRSDFSVELTAKQSRSRSSLRAEDLVGKRIRVHGWIEGWRSPRMVIDDLRLIEELAEDAPVGPPESQAETSDAQPIPAVSR